MNTKTVVMTLFIIPGMIFSLLLLFAKSFLPVWIMLIISCLVGMLFYAKTVSILTFSSTEKATESVPISFTSTSSKLKNFWEKYDIWGRMVLIVLVGLAYLLAWLIHS